jgi:hypothetical protein
MARGWESKAVEDQVQQSQASEKTYAIKPLLGSAELVVQRRREVLLLSKVRVQRDLEVSRSARYRDQLARALADIEAQLAALDDPA